MGVSLLAVSERSMDLWGRGCLSGRWAVCLSEMRPLWIRQSLEGQAVEAGFFRVRVRRGISCEVGLIEALRHQRFVLRYRVPICTPALGEALDA